MKLDRRTFLGAGAAAGAALAGGPRAGRPQEAEAAREKEPKAVLKISSQEGRIPGNTIAEKVALMQKWGIEGFEPGGGGLAGRVTEIKNALQGTGIKVSAICAGFQGVPISDQESERRKFVESAKEILQAAGELGSTGLIFVPAFNGQTKREFVEGRRILVEEVLPGLADFATSPTCAGKRPATWALSSPVASMCIMCTLPAGPGSCPDRTSATSATDSGG